MTIRQALNNARCVALSIEADKQLRKRIDAMIRLRSTTSDSSQCVNGVDLDTVRAQALKLDRRIASDVSQMLSLIDSVNALLDGLDNPEHKTVLTMRYLLCKRWDEIANAMHYGRRTVIRLHDGAVKLLESKYGTQWHT